MDNLRVNVRDGHIDHNNPVCRLMKDMTLFSSLF